MDKLCEVLGTGLLSFSCPWTAILDYCRVFWATLGNLMLFLTEIIYSGLSGAVILTSRLFRATLAVLSLLCGDFWLLWGDFRLLWGDFWLLWGIFGYSGGILGYPGGILGYSRLFWALLGYSGLLGATHSRIF